VADVAEDADPASLELIDLGAATVGESGGVAMCPRIRSVWRGALLAAPAFTARCVSGDNLAIHVAVARAPSGSALVVSVGEDEEFGYWGEVLTTAAESRDLRGLVIEGGVRDSEALASHGFPVFATTLALKGASKKAGGEVGIEVSVGGTRVRSGDWVIGDGDGVVVVEQEMLDAVIAASRARAQKEKELFARLRGGATTVELLGLDPSAVREPR